MKKCSQLAEKFVKEAQYTPVILDMGTAEKPDLGAIINNVNQLAVFIDKLLEANKNNPNA